MKVIKKILCLILVLIIGLSIYAPTFAWSSIMEDAILADKATDCVKFDINVKYHQDEARQMLNLVNNLRKEKGLNELVYDYELETFSMLRAAECGVYYEGSPHVSPNGIGGPENGKLLYKDSPRVFGENQATGRGTVEEAFNAWKNSPGHYVAMVDKDATRISIACAEFSCGVRAWMMNLTSDDFIKKSDIVTPTDEDWHRVTIESSASHIESLTPQIINIVYGEIYDVNDLYVISKYILTKENREGRDSGGKLYPKNVEWSIADENIAKIIDDKIVPMSIGSTTIETTFAGFDISIPLTINPIDISDGELVLSNNSVSFNDYVNNGISLEPDVQINLGGQILSDKNYTVTYNTNDNLPGKANVTVNGIGVYGGTITKDYNIVCDHQYEAVITPSSCTAEGYTTNTCYVCGDTYKSNPTDKLAHKLEITENKEPTCTEDGYIVKNCINCDYSETITAETDKTLKAKGHSEVNCAAVAPTCTQAGQTEGIMCSVCQESLSGLEPIEPLGHILVTKLTSDGTVQTTYCTRGYDVYTDIPKSEYISSESQYNSFFDMKVYNFTNKYTNALKITFSNDTTGTITVSNSSLSKTYAQGNLAGKTVEINDNCFSIFASQDAKFSFSTMQAKYSGNCDYTETIELSHNYTSEITKSATCVEEGIETFTCINCDDSFTTVIPRTEHVAGKSEEVVIKEASCVETGLKEVTSYCKECNEKISTEQIVISALSHDYVVVDSKDATCLEEGYKNYKCSRCGEEYTETISNTNNHSYQLTDEIAATCTMEGVREYICTLCNDIKTETIAAKGHDYKTAITKATTSKNGSSVTKCSVCGNIKANTSIAYPKAVSLSASSYTYDGKAKKPTITVKDSAGKTIGSSNYTVIYSGNTNVGTATVKITFKGNYSGTISKTFKINPKNTSISSVTAQYKGFTVKWSKQATQTTGYQIQYSTASDFNNAKTVTISSNGTVSKTVTGLTAKKKYYIRIRTYKTVSGTKYYSSWSGSKNVTTSSYPTTIALSATSYTYDGKAKKPSVTVKNNGTKINSKYYTVSYSSGRKNVGTYTVTIKFKSPYSGTVKKTFKINPKGTSISKLTATSKGFTINWNKQQTQTTGYQIQYATNSSFSDAKTVTMNKSSYSSKKITGLTGNKKYYVRIRTYKTVSGASYYSGWSSVKGVTTKK